MIITACLAYYAETCETLRRCVASLAGVADRLVALDGRWEHFPAVVEQPHLVAQMTAIEETCRSAGIRCEFGSFGIPEFYESQVEKRRWLMFKATRGSDWLFVIDADEFVEGADRGTFRRLLDDAERDVAQVNIRRHPVDASSYARRIRRLYRASVGVSLRTAHNGYVTADGRWLHGDPEFVELEPALDLSAHLMLGHDIEARRPERLQARIAYNQARREQRFESWAPKRKVLG